MTDASGDPPGRPPPDPEAPLTRREAANLRDAARTRDRDAQPGADTVPNAEPSVEPVASGVPNAVPIANGANIDPASFQAQVRAARSGLESQVAQARAEFEEANERIKERTGRNLIVAILIGLTLGAVLILSLFVWKWAFGLFAAAAMVLGILEISRAMNTAGRRVDRTPHLIAGTGLILSGYFLDSWMQWVALFCAVAFVIVWRAIAQMAARDGRAYGDVLSDVMAAGFIQVYIPFLAALCITLVRLDGGEKWVFAFILIAVAADTGAYATGLTLGKHPMAPRISPKKTWEGFAGAAVTAVVVAILLALFLLGLPWWTGLIIGTVLLLTATIGDLGESMIKRDLGIKDMSSWIPGHGGVLDRLDSILTSSIAALALYYLLNPLAA